MLTRGEFGIFNWNTLRPEATVYVDGEGSVKTADLVFSVKVKRGGKKADIMLLLEHKSYQRKEGVMQRILQYQTALYAKRKNPVIPVLVHQGRGKTWKHPLDFQGSLDGMEAPIVRHFGKRILNFSCLLLNLQDFGHWGGKSLTSDPIFFIMANIWRMDRRTPVTPPWTRLHWGSRGRCARGWVAPGTRARRPVPWRSCSRKIAMGWVAPGTRARRPVPWRSCSRKIAMGWVGPGTRARRPAPSLIAPPGRCSPKLRGVMPALPRRRPRLQLVQLPRHSHIMDTMFIG